ncbi:MAG TPA: phenylacetate--CoA ligase [Bacteroidales bacterium]|nr:phenylacetate--CoA ligase [Bacteroidales bacterium]HQJ83279.1 phenylacetate--CoA ligase [Bacteroidales bacterium]
MNTNIWNRHFECMERDDLRYNQERRLRETVERVYFNVPYYRHKMQEAGLGPESVNTLEDLRKLPFTTKDDLRDNYPFGLFAVPMSEIVRLHASSGTTGKPTVVGYTRNDIATWSEVMARTLACAGAGRDDFIHIAYGYGLFTGGLGLHYGGEKIGASVIPISGGNTTRQLQLMRDLGSTILACTPSYALFLAEAIQENGVNRSDLKLKAGVLGAEPWTENMRKEIEKKLEIKAIDIYGLSEVIGPGVASECMVQNGLHVNEDHFYPEIIDPDTLEVLPEGAMGELVFTTITKEGLPLIRYRTRDLTRLNYEKCECGRTFVRMEKCLGRSDDMLIVRGVNLFPSQIETVLLEMKEIKPHYLIIVDRIHNLDTLELQVEVDEEFFQDKISQLQIIRGRLQDRLENAIGLSIKVTLVEPKTIERSEGKSQRVIDRRKF